jgi:hypothetical protein
MAKRTVYHVIPDEFGWKVKKEGAEKASGVFNTKDLAIEKAKELAKNAGRAQVKIHRQNGTFQTEYTYTDDPYPPEG